MSNACGRVTVFVPDTTPATEWILGHPVMKLSPRRRHALLQARLAMYLGVWARGRGEVGTEWKFRLTPPGEYTRPLVSDIAFISFESLDAAGQRGAEEPRVAPDVAFEINSPGDQAARTAHKAQVYLASGARAVIFVDPPRRTIECLSSERTVVLRAGDIFAHAALPGFALTVDELFAVLDSNGRGSSY